MTAFVRFTSNGTAPKYSIFIFKNRSTTEFSLLYKSYPSDIFNVLFPIILILVFSALNLGVLVIVFNKAYTSVMDVGSGVVSSNQSELAKTISITASDMPAPVSIIIISAKESSPYIILIIPDI